MAGKHPTLLLSKKNLRTAIDKPVVRQFVSMRKGQPFKPAHSELRVLRRWTQTWMWICADKNATAVSQTKLHAFSRETAEFVNARKLLGVPGRLKHALQPHERQYLTKVAPLQATDRAERLESHPVIDLLCRPNPITDGASLMWLTAGSLQFMGECFWKLCYGPDGTPEEIWVLPAQNVFPILGEDQLFDEYEFRVGGYINRYPASEIVHFRKPSIIDTISGFGALRGVIESAETAIRMQEFERALFENMAIPDALLTPRGDTTPDQMESLRKSWIQEYGGWNQAGKIAAAPVDVDVHRLQLNMRELAHEKTRNLIREEIAAGFGVPLPILFAEGTTFSNMFTAIQTWARFTILPLCTKIAETINNEIMPLYSPTEDELGGMKLSKPPFFVAFENPVPEDEDKLAEREINWIQAGWKTINESRERMGMVPVSWGDEPWMNGALAQPEKLSGKMDAEIAKTRFEIERGSDDNEEIKVSELSGLMQMAVNHNDLPTYNMARRKLAMILGETPPPDVTEIAPRAGAGMVEPDEAERQPDLVSEEELERQEDAMEKQEDIASAGSPPSGGGGAGEGREGEAEGEDEREREG